MATENVTIQEAFEAWNRCNLSDTQLDKVITSLAITISTLTALDGGRLLVASLYQNLLAAENMKRARIIAEDTEKWGKVIRVVTRKQVKARLKGE